MNKDMIQSKPGKSLYSENEAAAMVGVSVEELRTLVRKIAGHSDDSAEDIKGAMYQPRDLVLLKLCLAGVQTAASAAPVS